MLYSLRKGPRDCRIGNFDTHVKDDDEADGLARSLVGGALSEIMAVKQKLALVLTQYKTWHTSLAHDTS